MPFIRNGYRLIIDGYIVIHILLIVITQFLCISSCYDFLTLNLNTLDNFSCFLFLKSTLFVLSKVIAIGKLVFVNSRANTFFFDIPEVVYTCYKGMINFSVTITLVNGKTEYIIIVSFFQRYKNRLFFYFFITINSRFEKKN